MKRIFRTNYIELNLIPYFGIGVGYNDEIFVLLFPFLSVEVKMWMFKPKVKK